MKLSSDEEDCYRKHGCTRRARFPKRQIANMRLSFQLSQAPVLQKIWTRMVCAVRDPPLGAQLEVSPICTRRSLKVEMSKRCDLAVMKVEFVCSFAPRPMSSACRTILPTPVFFPPHKSLLCERARLNFFQLFLICCTNFRERKGSHNLDKEWLKLPNCPSEVGVVEYSRLLWKKDFREVLVAAVSCRPAYVHSVGILLFLVLDVVREKS